MYITYRKWWRPWDTGNVNIWVKIVGWAVSEPIDSFIFPSGVISQMFIELIWPTCFSSFGITVDKSVRCSCRIISWHIVILNWGNPLCHYFSLVLSYDILISLTRAYLVISTVKYLPSSDPVILLSSRRTWKQTMAWEKSLLIMDVRRPTRRSPALKGKFCVQCARAISWTSSARIPV